MREKMMTKLFFVALPLLAAVLLAAKPAAAQAMNFACKPTRGYEPQSRFFDFYDGRCDANGLFQGEGIAMVRAGLSGGYLRARFIDGLPAAGPAILRSDPRAFSPREQANHGAVCKVNFVSPTQLEGDIQCSFETREGAQTSVRTWRLSAASGFQLEWTQGARRPNGQPLPPGNYLKASAVLVQAEGPVLLKLSRDFHDDDARTYAGQLLATADLNSASLVAPLNGNLPLENAKVELKTLSVRPGRSHNVTLSSITGHVEIGLPFIQISPGNHSGYFVTSGKAQLSTGHPVDKEVSFKYSNGYEATIVSGGIGASAYFYFKDNQDVEFSGFIPECMRPGKTPGVLRFGSGWPSRYLLTDTHTNGHSGPTPARGSQFLPSGCGMFKTSGNPELRGEFKTRGNSDATVFTPF